MALCSGSGETTASDMMKCLQALRIQDVSVTNSTPTPSGASIPRLAPPPLSSRGSVHSNSTETCQTWPNIQIRSIVRRIQIFSSDERMVIGVVRSGTCDAEE